MNFKETGKILHLDHIVHQSQEEIERENIPLNRKKQKGDYLTA